MKFDGRQQPVGKTGSESRLSSRLDLMGLSALYEYSFISINNQILAM
jgi:hypothetical protein